MAPEVILERKNAIEVEFKAVVLKRLWMQAVNQKLLNQYLANRSTNFKTYADIAPSKLTLRKNLTELDIRTGSNFILFDDLPTEELCLILAGKLPNMC